MLLIVKLRQKSTCAVGNRSLDAWRSEHLSKFSRYGEVNENTELVCVNFRVVESLEWAYFNPMPTEKFKSRSALGAKL